MIFPKDVGPLDQTSWGVVITYAESGYVKDDDAEKINPACSWEKVHNPGTYSYIRVFQKDLWSF
jgi:hypothetical protein